MLVSHLPLLAAVLPAQGSVTPRYGTPYRVDALLGVHTELQLAHRTQDRQWKLFSPAVKINHTGLDQQVVEPHIYPTPDELQLYIGSPTRRG